MRMSGIERLDEGIWGGGDGNVGGGTIMCGGRRQNAGMGDARIWGSG